VPFDREDALKKAEKFLRLGRLDSAIAEYQRVVDEVPGDWKTLNALADLYLRANQPGRATALFVRIADHLAGEGFSARAEAFYKRILKVEPHHERTLDALAGLAVRQGILVEAKTYLLALARARQGRGDRRGAAEVLLRVNTLDPADFGARREAARTAAQGGNQDLAARELLSIAADLSADGRRAEAVEALQEGITLVPEDRTLRDRLMDYAVAARTFEPLMALTGSAADYVALSDRLAGAGWAEGAALALDEASGRDVDDPAMASRLFAHHLDRGHLESAKRFARTTGDWLALSEASEQSGNLSAAEAAVEEALRLEPESREARTRAARLRTGLGDHEGALEHLASLGHTDDPGTHLLAVESGLRSGRHDEALRRLAALLDDGRVAESEVGIFVTTLACSDPAAGWPALELLIDRLVDAANPTAASGYLRDFTDRHPNHVGGLMKLVEVSVDIGSEEELTDAQARLAEAYLAVGSGAEARVIAEDLVSRSPQDPRRRDCLRRALALVGEPDPDRAVRDFAGHAAAREEPFDAGLLEADLTVAAAAEVPESAQAARQLFELGPAAIDLSDILNEVLDQDEATGDAAGSEAREIDLTEVLKELRPATVRAGMGSQKGSKMSDKPERSNLDEVFRDFREEVSRQTAADEAEQHYKVALTYRDMGMLDDAVRELEQAARAPKLRFEAASILARLLRDRGDAPTAIEWFERAAEAPAPTPEAGRALLYELGQALESCGEVARALAVYLELQADAGEYGDLKARVERLSRVQAEG
jgi:tetratricopeptide (TPR) repeat protein